MKAAHLALAAAAMVSPGAARAASACSEDPLAHESRGAGDDLRPLAVLRQRELERRGTPAGLDCARMILGAYVRHGELDLADDWVTRLPGWYAPLLAPGLAPRLHVEVAYLGGDSAEVERRAAESGLPGLERLTILARAAELPLSFDARAAAACADIACAELRRILDDRGQSPHKSPGLALALGVVPGLGQVYAGRPLAGLGSFLLDGFLIGATAFAVHRQEYALAVLSGGIGLAFYAGGIYSGYEAAARVNEHAADELRARIRAVPVDLAINGFAF
jgi:hypothetical protein